MCKLHVITFFRFDAALAFIVNSKITISFSTQYFYVFVGKRFVISVKKLAKVFMAGQNVSIGSCTPGKSLPSQYSLNNSLSTYCKLKKVTLG